MKSDKIIISKVLAEYMEGVIKEYYGNIACFSKLMKLDEADLNACVSEHKISVSLLARLYEPLKLSLFDEGMIIDYMQLLKEKIKETGKSICDFEDEAGYEQGTITKAINRKHLSSKLEEDICSVLEDWKPFSSHSKIKLATRYAVNFNEPESCESVLRVFKEIVSKFKSHQLLFLKRNIELFCSIDRYDWKFLCLIQGVHERDRVCIEEFIESHALVKDNEKCRQCESLKAIEVSEIEDTKKTRLQYIDEIISGIEKSTDNLGLRYIIINLLIQMTPYIFYLTESDCRIIGKFSLLENWDNRKDFYKYKNWTINYVRGLVQP